MDQINQVEQVLMRLATAEMTAISASGVLQAIKEIQAAKESPESFQGLTPWNLSGMTKITPAELDVILSNLKQDQPPPDQPESDE